MTSLEPVDLSGVVHRRKNLLASGYTDRHIAALVTSGALHRVRRGEYVDGPLWHSLSTADKHRVLLRAVLLTGHPTAVATHVSAAIERGAPIWDLPLGIAHTTRRDAKAGRRRHDWVQHCGQLPDEHVETLNGVPIGSAARTCVEITTITDVERSLVVVNGLLNSKATTREEFASLATDTRYWPRSLATDLVVRLCNPLLESAGETRFDYLCWRQHLPRPKPQVEVFDENHVLVGRVDFLWPKEGVFVEFDGRVKYTRHRRPNESLEHYLMREKKREETICQLTGWVCLRVTWADLAGPELLARRIEKILAARAPRLA